MAVSKVEVRPSDGGQLMPDHSANELGAANYTIKRDWRRVLEKEVTSEGYDYFWGNPEKALGDQPFPNQPNVDEPINLVHMGRRPNGQTAVFVATPTKIFRFFSFEDSTYVEADSNGEYAAGDVNGPYFEDISGEWILIGSGFADASGGARRWQAEDANGYVIFNNGRDLPQVYRLEWTSVQPLYELREGGVAHVGSMRVTPQGILSFGDIREINETELDAIFSLTESDTVVAEQTGSTYSGAVTASQTSGSATVTASASFFTGAMVGKTLRYFNGWSSVISSVASGTQAQLADQAPATITNDTFYIVGADANEVVSDNPFFAPAMVGLKMRWATGETRLITAFVDQAKVEVDLDFPVASGTVEVENDSAYARYTKDEFVTYRHYRWMWGMPGEPTKWSPVFKGTIASGSRTLTIDKPAKSIEIGMSILVTGAGASGANLISTVKQVDGLGKTIRLEDAAETSVTDATTFDADTVGSVMGFRDLQGDGSGILNIENLQNVVVIYKDTSAVLADYTGDADAPWNFRSLDFPAGKSLFYRWTLINVQGLFHVYAGSTSFYRFDLTNRIPSEIPGAESLKSIFFDRVSLKVTDEVWAADNANTKQLVIGFPSADNDKLLLFDYLQNTFSTSSMDITAAATVKRPESGLSVGETDNWFVMGNGEAVVLIYGKVSQALSKWGAAKQIYYRRHAYPYDATKLSYDAVLSSGLTDFGSEDDEKMVMGFVPILSSQQRSLPDMVAVINIWGAWNPSQAEDSLLASYSIPDPETKNLVPLFFLANYFRHQIKVTVNETPAELSMWIWHVRGLRSNSISRAQTT